MSTLQVEQIKRLLSTFGRDVTDGVSVLQDLLFYLLEYGRGHGDLTKELVKDQIEFNFEEFEQYIDGLVFFKDQLRSIIDGVVYEDSGITEVHAD